MAKKQHETPPVREVTTEATAQAPPLPLDVLIPAGSVPLTENGPEFSLHKASQFETDNRRELKSLYDGEENCAVRVGATALPISAGELYLERLRTLRAVLSSTAVGADLKKTVSTAQEKVNETLEGNLQTVMAGQRKVERAWRELDAFIKLARTNATAAVPLRVANVSVEALCEEAPFEQLSRIIPRSSATSMKEMVAMLVLPDWVHSLASLKKFGELAVDATMLVVAGVPEDLEKAKGLFGRGGTLDIAGNAPWQQQVVLVGNNLRVRQPHPYEGKGAGPMYISAATVLAAQIVKGDETQSLAEAQAGDAREILLEGVDGALWDFIDRKEIIAQVGDRVIPIAKKGNKLVFWGVKTLYDVSEDDETFVFGQYPVVRVRDYIGKVLVEFMNSDSVFRHNTQARRNQLKDTLNRFLRENSGDADETKMLRGGECLYVKSGQTSGGIDDETKLDIKLVLKFKTSVENVNIEMKAQQVGAGWEKV